MSFLTRVLSLRNAKKATKEARSPRPSSNELAALVNAGRYPEALQSIDAALADRPDDVDALFARGSLLFTWGRPWEARADLLRAWQQGFRGLGLDLQLCWIELRNGRVDDAERWARSGIDQDPANWQGHFALGAALRAKGRLDLARECFEHALGLSPDNLDCLLNRVACVIAAKDFPRAEEYARDAVARHPTADMAWAALGAALIWQDRFDEANDAFAHVPAIANPGSSGSTGPPDAGIPLRDGGRVSEAIAFYRRLLPSNPDLNAHANYAFSLLKAGYLREGFEQNEFRWMIEPLRSIHGRTSFPVWSGQDIRGKTVLLTTEQGVGDVIQFIRFAPLVKRLGAKVLVLLRKSMREIVDGIEGVDEVHQLGDALPTVDFEIPVMSLPRIFGTTIETIPAKVPYIPLNSDRVEHWRRTLSPYRGQLNVGIAWNGDPIGLRNPYKSIPIRMLAHLAGVSGVRFFSLQKGDAARDTALVAGSMDLVDLSPQISDFADTAAIMDSLDLIISICTSVAHLSGALGRPTWTLLSEPADWRWLENREDTPWYPTMRLFRQPRQGDWASVVEAVKLGLADLAERPSEVEHSPDRTMSPVQAIALTSPEPPSDSLCRAVGARFGMIQVRPDRTRRVRSLMWYGEYLRVPLDLLAASIKPGSIIVDIGSAFGCDVPLLASAAGGTGHLFLFESRRALLPLLANNLAGRISNATTITTRVRGACLAANGEDSDNEASNPTPVSLDELGLPPFHWLKINEDNRAVELLDGAGTCLWKHRPGLFVTVTGHDEMLQVEERVRDFGYHSVRIDSPLFNPRNFNRRVDDIFGGHIAHVLFAVPEESDRALPALKLFEEAARVD